MQVLRFDVEGNSSFEEVSRVDMLRMTQEAAMPALVPVSDGGVRAPGSVQNIKQTKLVGPTVFGTICDVQVIYILICYLNYGLLLVQYGTHSEALCL